MENRERNSKRLKKRLKSLKAENWGLIKKTNGEVVLFFDYAEKRNVSDEQHDQDGKIRKVC